MDRCGSAYSSGEGHLHLLEFLLRWRLRQELWLANGPFARESLFGTAAAPCRGGRRVTWVGEAKRSRASLDRGRVAAADCCSTDLIGTRRASRAGRCG